ncbi:hypothetical protein CPB84DRAFT_1786166, partial [Gymnopilus junonius]
MSSSKERRSLRKFRTQSKSMVHTALRFEWKWMDVQSLFLCSLVNWKCDSNPSRNPSLPSRVSRFSPSWIEIFPTSSSIRAPSTHTIHDEPKPETPKKSISLYSLQSDRKLRTRVSGIGIAGWVFYLDADVGLPPFDSSCSFLRMGRSRVGFIFIFLFLRPFIHLFHLACDSAI